MDQERIIAEYRGLLTETEQKSQSEFDKCVLALSGGALGLTFTFAKNIIPAEVIVHPWYLLTAWVSWALSSTAVLLSFFFSTLALRKAIRQLDQGTIGMGRPGGWWDCATSSLNLIGLVLFLTGLATAITFLSYNLHLK